MARIFLYEYCTALGLGRNRNDPAHSLYREGMAMRDAMHDDIIQAGHEVLILDHVAAEKEYFMLQLQQCDFAIVIAPEFDELLLQRSQWVDDVGIARLGPSLDAIRLTSDKWALAHHWQRHGIATPQTRLLEQAQPQAFTQVVKARYGAGGLHMQQITAHAPLPRNLPDAIVQPWHDGIHASQALLIGPSCIVPLPPARQKLQWEPEFAYHGGVMPIEPALARRVTNVAMRCVESVPGLYGYVGVDVLLTPAKDYAIEINPRLTTSYLGYRQLVNGNLLTAWLAIHANRTITLTYHNDKTINYSPV